MGRSVELLSTFFKIRMKKGAPCILKQSMQMDKHHQTYKKDVDELVPHVERMDWEGLRKQLMETGIPTTQWHLCLVKQFHRFKQYKWYQTVLL